MDVMFKVKVSHTSERRRERCNMICKDRVFTIEPDPLPYLDGKDLGSITSGRPQLSNNILGRIGVLVPGHDRGKRHAQARVVVEWVRWHVCRVPAASDTEGLCPTFAPRRGNAAWGLELADRATQSGRYRYVHASA